jgi:uroporphyrinogen decarboxylase
MIDLLRDCMQTDDAVRAFDLDFRTCWGYADNQPPQVWREAYARLGVQLPADAQVGYCGITHRIPDRATMGRAYHLREMIHPLQVVQSVEQLQSLPWPRLEAAHQDRLDRFARDAHSEGKVAFVMMECTVFEPAWYLRGMENLLLDLADENGIGGWLLDWFTQRSVRTAQMCCAADVDVIGLGDDVAGQRGMLMSVEFWRRHLKPRLKRVIDAIRAGARRKIYIRYHSDGDVRPIINDLIEIGIDLLNPVQPECMPLDEVIPQYRSRVGFWGTVGIQTLLPFGTPDQIRRHVQRCAAHARDGATIVIAPTHVVEPDVPWENLCALIEAIKQEKLS